jgi:signal transduction histidine kinase
MADLRRSSGRLVLGLAVVVLILLEILGLTGTLRSQARVQGRVLRMTRDAALVARPRLAEMLLPGGPQAWSTAADAALRSSLAAELEVFDLSGRARLAHPRPAPVSHWLGPDEQKAVENGGVLVVGPIAQRYTRLLTYLSFRSGDETVILRLSNAMPELQEDLEERRSLLLGHGVVLVLLVVIGALLLFPGPADSPLSPSALGAYEAAMERLQARGQELSHEHELERRRMEEAMQEKEAMARAGELTAGIAHEVRNGLGTILGYARLVERAKSKEEIAEAAARIREECEILEGVVRRFMDFVKQETLRLAPFDLRPMLRRVAAREIRSRPGAPVSLPEGDPVTLVGDEELLERAFENLVRNAREAAGPAGHVGITLEPSVDGELSVTIVDDGPGLPPGSPTAPRPFFTTKPGGLGLGLPLAVKILRLHHGDLRLDNHTPRGLAACVRLPAGGPEAAAGVTVGNHESRPQHVV